MRCRWRLFDNLETTFGNGSPEDEAEGSLPPRSIHFRSASITKHRVRQLEFHIAIEILRCTQTSARAALPLFTLEWWPRLSSVQSTFGYCLLWGNLQKTTFDQMEVQGVLLIHPVWILWIGKPRHRFRWRLSMESVIAYPLDIVAYVPLHPPR